MPDCDRHDIADRNTLSQKSNDYKTVSSDIKVKALSPLITLIITRRPFAWILTSFMEISALSLHQSDPLMDLEASMG